MLQLGAQRSVTDDRHGESHCFLSEALASGNEQRQALLAGKPSNAEQLARLRRHGLGFGFEEGGIEPAANDSYLVPCRGTAPPHQLAPTVAADGDDELSGSNLLA